MKKVDAGGVGRIFKRPGSKFYWVQLGSGGDDVRMSTKQTTEKAARDFLKTKIAEAATGTLNPAADRLTFEGAWAALEHEDALGRHGRNFARGRKLVKARLKAHFAMARARAIPAMAERYVVACRARGAADASIRGDLYALRKALRVAGAAQVAERMRKAIGYLERSAPRQGFVNAEQLESICRRMDGPRSDGTQSGATADVARFLFESGWRWTETIELTWKEVDLDEQAIRLPGSRSKNGRARLLPYGPNPRLGDLIERRHATCDAIERDRRARGSIEPVERVFCWDDGSPIVSFKRSWRSACRAAGLPGILLHDLRRSFARRLSNMGVSHAAIKKLGGWESDDVFNRYRIVSPDDLEDAMRRSGEVETAPRRARGATASPKTEA